MSKPRGVLAGLMGIWLISFSGIAAAENGVDDTTLVTVSGTLLDSPPECTFFGNNNHMHIDFGDEIVTHQINEGEYVARVRLELTCQNLAHQKLKLTFKGTPVSFDNQVYTLFSTSNPRLGIAVSYWPPDGTAGVSVSPDSEVTFMYDERERISLSVGLWSDRTATPQAGYFTGAITLAVAYQ